MTPPANLADRQANALAKSPHGSFVTARFVGFLALYGRRGHRLPVSMAKQPAPPPMVIALCIAAPITLSHADHYEASLEAGFRNLRALRRGKALINDQLNAAAPSQGGASPPDDPALLEEVTALTEWPASF